MYDRRTPTRAFTLIELLVVVAIIAMLISILLPALGRAKENGRRAVCLSNLHHLGVAFKQYFNDHDDILPDAAMLPSANPEDPNADDYHPPITEHLKAYARDPELFRCPSDMPGKVERDEELRGKTFWETENTSYEYTFIISTLSEVLGVVGIRAKVSVGDTYIKWALPIPPPENARRFLQVRTSDLHLLKEYAPYHGRRGKEEIVHTLYADCHVEEHWRMWDWPEDPENR